MPWACAKSTLGKRKGIGGHSEATPGGTVGSRASERSAAGRAGPLPYRHGSVFGGYQPNRSRSSPLSTSVR